MPISLRGMKTAARLIGVTVEEYRTKREAGLKRCRSCQGWCPEGDFNVDRSRSDGLQTVCRPCLTGAPSTAHLSPLESAEHRENSRRAHIKEAWKARKPNFVPPMKGKKMSDESREKMSEAGRGRPSKRLGVKHTPETRAKITASLLVNAPRGKGHPRFSHGRFQVALNDRLSTKYKAWRLAVFTRDHFACQRCGDSRGGNLQAHHVKSFADHPDLRFETDNGITICRDCHEKIHLKPIPTPRDLRRRRKHKT